MSEELPEFFLKKEISPLSLLYSQNFDLPPVAENQNAFVRTMSQKKKIQICFCLKQKSH